MLLFSALVCLAATPFVADAFSWVSYAKAAATPTIERMLEREIVNINTDFYVGGQTRARACTKDLARASKLISYATLLRWFVRFNGCLPYSRVLTPRFQAERTPLDDYVLGEQQPKDPYKYELRHQYGGQGFRFYVLRVTSLKWMNSQ